MARSLVEQALHDPKKLKEVMGILQGDSPEKSQKESVSSRLHDLESRALDRAEFQRVLPEVLELYRTSLELHERIYSLLFSIYEQDADQDKQRTG